MEHGVGDVGKLEGCGELVVVISGNLYFGPSESDISDAQSNVRDGNQGLLGESPVLKCFHSTANSQDLK